MPTPLSPPRSAHRWLERCLSVIALAVLVATCVRSAWQGDDAYITHRSAANLLAGHGPVWNPGERVQAFTHPTWFVASWGCQALFGEPYFSILGLSLLLVLAAASLLVFAIARRPVEGALGVLALSASPAVVDFGVSGLENPLLYLLLVLFVALAVRPGVSERRLLLTGLLASLCALTRLDAVLFVGPALVVLALELPSRRRALLGLVAGAAPLVVWELFSLAYYGLLVPNTALAKLDLAIPTAGLVAQGLRYHLDLLTRDPLAATLLVLGLATVAWQRTRRPRGRMILALALGQLLYLVYVVRIGGDFMGGRFFAAPVVVSVALLLAILPPLRPKALALVGACVTLAGLGVAGTRWRTDASFGADRGRLVSNHGIADERAYYYPTTGLLPVLQRLPALAAAGAPIPPYPGAIKGREYGAAGIPAAVKGEIGYFGYFAGPTVHVIDVWALSDPLLARQTFAPRGAWRVGHYERTIPRGYLETLASGENRLVDPALAAAYDSLRLVVRGPLWTRERWIEIWRLHSGASREVFARSGER